MNIQKDLHDEIKELITKFLKTTMPYVKEADELERDIARTYCFGVITGLAIERGKTGKDVESSVAWVLRNLFGYSDEVTQRSVEDLILCTNESYQPVKYAIIHKGIEGYSKYKEGDIDTLALDYDGVVDVILENVTEKINAAEVPEENYSITAMSPDRKWLVVFEDDGESAWMYFLPMSLEDGQPLGISDALWVYDRIYPSIYECNDVYIGWSEDSTKAALIVDDENWGMFDLITNRKVNTERKNNCIIPIPVEVFENGIPDGMGSEIEHSVQGVPLN